MILDALWWLQGAVTPPVDGWVVRSVFLALLTVTGFFMQRTLSLLDAVADKVNGHGEKIAAHGVEIKNLKQRYEEGDA
jgi:hypothetical protein